MKPTQTAPPAAIGPKARVERGQVASKMRLSDRELPLYSMPGHLVRRLQQVAVSLFANGMRAIDEELTPVQYAALRGIAHNPGLDQATLAGMIAYDRATIGGVIDRLEAKGLVRRTTSAEDRRIRKLALEPAGQQLLERVGSPVLAVQAEILSPLTDSERTVFLELLGKLTAAHNESSRAPLRPVDNVPYASTTLADVAPTGMGSPRRQRPRGVRGIHD